MPLRRTPINQTNIVHAVDEHGDAIVKVQLSNAAGLFATVLKEDFDRLAAEGYRPRWFLNRNSRHHQYVRCNRRDVVGNVDTVARLVLGLGPRQQVHYVNGDRLDLRRRNLEIRRGRNRGQTPRSKPEDVILGHPAPFAPSGILDRLPDASTGLSFAFA